MTYYDIHTHHPAKHTADIAVISVDISRETIQSKTLSAKNSPENQQIQPNLPPTPPHYSVGIHPRHIGTTPNDEVRKNATQPAIVAIGETGLDRTSAKDATQFKQQQQLFTAHAALSEQVRKPLIIHCVKAWDELLHIRKTTHPSMPWIIHNFRGKDTLASQLIHAGCYLSFGKHHHTKALQVAWQEQRLLAETDNTEIHIRNIYTQIATELNITEETLSQEIAPFFNTQILIPH
jgi:TatD DNase family protein